MKANRTPKRKELRVIKTARTKKAINQAAQEGFRPLVKLHKPSEEIHSKFCVWQNQTTGEIEVVGDYRIEAFDKDWKKVIDWTQYYPNRLRVPFAAYLIPADITLGERVYVEDLIEDFIGMSWNQGDTFRLNSCAAVWDGSDLKIDYQPSRDRQSITG